MWIVLLLGGCQGASVEEQLVSSDPSTRIRAVLSISRDGAVDYLPALVERLDDDDAGVRQMAILGLERLTGERLGYAAGASPAQRRAACEAWQQYLTDHGHVHADAVTAPVSGGRGAVAAP